MRYSLQKWVVGAVLAVFISGTAPVWAQVVSQTPLVTRPEMQKMQVDSGSQVQSVMKDAAQDVKYIAPENVNKEAVDKEKVKAAEEMKVGK